jgi:hypothetical protein
LRHVYDRITNVDPPAVCVENLCATTAKGFSVLAFSMIERHSHPSSVEHLRFEIVELFVTAIEKRFPLEIRAPLSSEF